MKAVVIIPARYASTRFPGKPLADINGKPMIRRVYEAAKEARLVDSVVVATDDDRIYKAVKAFGGKAVMTSDKHVSGTDRIAEAARTLSPDIDIIVNVQGDEPLMNPKAIDLAIDPFLAEPDLVMSSLRVRITDDEDYRNPNVVKVVVDFDDYALYFSRSPIPFDRAPFASFRAYKHIGLYVYSRDFLDKFAKLPPSMLEQAESLEQLRALENGIRIKVIETAYNPISVDTPEDIEVVRRIIASAKKV